MEKIINTIYVMSFDRKYKNEKKNSITSSIAVITIIRKIN